MDIGDIREKGGGVILCGTVPLSESRRRVACRMSHVACWVLHVLCCSGCAAFETFIPSPLSYGLLEVSLTR